VFELFILPPLLIGGLLYFLFEDDDDDGGSSEEPEVGIDLPPQPDLPPIELPPVTETPVPTVVGSNGPDLINLDLLNTDSVNALGGNDTVTTGLPGDVTVMLGNGDDHASIAGGHGHVMAGNGDDFVEAQTATLETFLGAGNDHAVAGMGAMFANGGPGADTLEGGMGADTLLGSTGFDTITGSGGADSMDGGYGNDTLDGGADNDTLEGGAGQDILRGGDGFDRLDGGAGNDTLEGGADADILTLSAGKDLLMGGAGGDDYKLSGGDIGDGTVIDDTTTEGEQDSWSDGLWMEELDGGITIDFDGSGTAMISGDGLDGTLETRGIFDFNIYRSSGDNVFDARGETEDMRFTAPEEIGNDTVWGGAGNDTLDAGWGSNLGGTSFVDGGAGNDDLAGSGTVRGGLGDDDVYGTGTLSGGDGNDQVEGWGKLSGDAGNDTLWTYDDNTSLGTELTGGEGTDAFWVDIGYSGDVPDGQQQLVARITDFEDGESIRLTVPKWHSDPDPVIDVQEDANANEVRIFVDGKSYIVVDGLSALPNGALQVDIAPYGPGS